MGCCGRGPKAGTQYEVKFPDGTIKYRPTQAQARILQAQNPGAEIKEVPAK